jgi:hypothetical protein
MFDRVDRLERLIDLIFSKLLKSDVFEILLALRDLMDWKDLIDLIESPDLIAWMYLIF